MYRSPSLAYIMACGMLQKLKLRSEIFLVAHDYV